MKRKPQSRARHTFLVFRQIIIKVAQSCKTPLHLNRQQLMSTHKFEWCFKTDFKTIPTVFLFLLQFKNYLLKVKCANFIHLLTENAFSVFQSTWNLLKNVNGVWTLIIHFPLNLFVFFSAIRFYSHLTTNTAESERSIPAFCKHNRNSIENFNYKKEDE